jgi:hypothetical protein
MEDKLASLVSQLESRKLLSSDMTLQPQYGIPVEQSEYLTSKTREDDAGASNDAVPLPKTSSLSAPVAATPTATGSEPLDPFSAACLEIFRSRMLSHFPIVHLSAGLNAEQLRRDRPLLFQAIACVAWPFPRERRARVVELKRTLCEAAFLRQAQEDHSGDVDSSADLMLGLLVYVAWGWDHVDGSGNLSRLMMLCMSLVGGMHLDRPAPPDLHTSNVFSPASRTRYGEREVSLERRRTALGCFVLSSIVSAFSAAINTLEWTPQMEESLLAIDATENCPSEASVVLQVRLELLSTKAFHLYNLLQQSNYNQPKLPAAKVFTDAEALLEKTQKLRESAFRLSQNAQSI